MKIELLTAAFNDLKRGRQFYEEQQEGLGRYFYDSLFSDIESLQLYAGIQPIVYGYYRLLCKRFPYAIYYKIKANENILIYRILDCRQSPNKTQNLLM